MNTHTESNPVLVTTLTLVEIKKKKKNISPIDNQKPFENVFVKNLFGYLNKVKLSMWRVAATDTARSNSFTPARIDLYLISNSNENNK